MFRAAKTARDLGYPAKHSPALGAWSPIIPVVNLWFPYQALRDCLPPGSEHRPLVLRAWLLLLGIRLVEVALIIALAEDRAVGVVLLVVFALLEVLLASLGWRMVNAITTDHSEALGLEQPKN